MIDIARDLAEVYAFTFLTGFGAYRLLVPDFLKTRPLFAIIVPGIGFAQFSLIAAYATAFDVSMAGALIAAAIAGATTILVSTLVLRNVAPVGGRLDFPPRLGRNLLHSSLATLIVIATLLTALSPVLHAGVATTPYRAGIDQVGYAESAQFLKEGGTLRLLRQRLLANLGTNSLQLAEQQNAKDSHFETYVDSEFLLKAKRWGYPGTLAAMTLLTGNEHVFALAFLLLIFSCALTLALVYHLGRVTRGLPRALALFVAVAVTLNCNLLNTYYEGQYGQVFATPFLLFIAVIYLRARTYHGFPGSTRTTLQIVATTALMVAALFSSYNESLIVLLVLIGLTTLIDLALYRKTNLIALSVILLGFSGGVALAGPFAQSWIRNLLANLVGLGRAGFWQPHWASLSEILGLNNMYATVGYALVQRGSTDSAINTAFSVLAAVIIARFFLLARGFDRSLFLAPFVMILLGYAKSRYVDDILNYPFMKLYTLLIPLISIAAISALYDYCTSLTRFARWIPYATCLAVVFSGSGYIYQYVNKSKVVTPEMLSLYSPGGRRFDDYALLTDHTDIEEYMYAPLLSMHWLDAQPTQMFLAPVLDKDIVVVVRPDYACRQCLATYFAGDIIYEDDTQLFINTRLKLRDFCDRAVRSQYVGELGSDGRRQWVTAERSYDGSYTRSYRQCDYSYVWKLVARASKTGP